VGLNISPYRSVLPSRALTVNGSGATQPAARRREMSPRATSRTSVPSTALRSSVTGAVAVVEYVSTNQVPPGGRFPLGAAYSGVSRPGATAPTPPPHTPPP